MLPAPRGDGSPALFFDPPKEDATKAAVARAVRRHGKGAVEDTETDAVNSPQVDAAEYTAFLAEQQRVEAEREVRDGVAARAAPRAAGATRAGGGGAVVPPRIAATASRVVPLARCALCRLASRRRTRRFSRSARATPTTATPSASSTRC